MTFSTVVFGSISVTSPGSVVFTPGNSISSGGLRLFIVPTINVGNKSIDIGFTYINQFGVQNTTAVTTPVAANTTSGTHVQVVLETGDTGIQRVISIFVNPGGGSAGDIFNLESWNEGLGAPAFEIMRTIPDLYYSNPQVQMDFLNLNLEGYLQEPMIDRNLLTRDEQIIKSDGILEWISEPMMNRGITSRDEQIIKSDGTLEWISEPTLRTFIGYEFILFRSWLESVVGQVISGYVHNLSGEVITNAFSLILMSTAQTETTPGGTSTVSNVNPSTGLYQTFLKQVIYDKRYIIIKIGLKNVVLEGAGIPTYVNGSQTLTIPYNLQFACPVIDCDFNITRKI